MSDFLLNVLNRHMGIGRRVQPRIRSRFERDFSVDSTRDYDSELVEPDANSCSSVAKPSSRGVEPAKVSSAGESVTDIMDDGDSEKYTVQSQQMPTAEPVEIIEQEIMQRNRKKSLPDYVSKSISKLPDMNDNEVISNRYKATDNTRQEIVMQSGDVTDDARIASKNDTGKRPDDKVQKVQKTSERLVSASKYYHSLDTVKRDKPINTATNINRKNSDNGQSKQHQQVTSELSSDQFENNIRPEKSLLEPQSRTISKQNINFEHQYLLQTSPRLTRLRSELHRNNVFLKDSKAETEPVTNVTIGRIEIRAIPPKSAEKMECKKKPSGIMSLDNYLSLQKQGGGR
jgi:hypothetical protein